MIIGINGTYNNPHLNHALYLGLDLMWMEARIIKTGRSLLRTMTRQVSISDLMNIISNAENFEVIDYQGDSVVIDEVKGIVKIRDEEARKELGELRRRAPRGKPTPKQLSITMDVVKKLVENRVKFKVIFGPKEVIIRFDLDHYVRLSDRDVRVVGFSSKDDGYLGLIADILERYGPLVFLRRVT
jgi:hypothetical protein